MGRKRPACRNTFHARSICQFSDVIYGWNGCPQSPCRPEIPGKAQFIMAPLSSRLGHGRRQEESGSSPTSRQPAPVERKNTFPVTIPSPPGDFVVTLSRAAFCASAPATVDTTSLHHRRRRFFASRKISKKALPLSSFYRALGHLSATINLLVYIDRPQRSPHLPLHSPGPGNKPSPWSLTCHRTIDEHHFLVSVIPRATGPLTPHTGSCSLNLPTSRPPGETRCFGLDNRDILPSRKIFPTLPCHQES